MEPFSTEGIEWRDRKSAIQARIKFLKEKPEKIEEEEVVENDNK